MKCTTLERNMQRYVAHLLSDLETATRNAPAASSYRFRHPFDEEEERDAPAYQLRYTRLCDLFGLPTGIFPPSERLTKDHVSLLLSAIEALWRAWNIGWECPPSLTARRRYTVMVEYMEQDPVRYSHEYGSSLNFCDRRAEGICPFGENGQCWCDELDACARHDLEIWENARDFDGAAERAFSAVEDFHHWLEGNQADLPPWELDEERERWNRFVADETREPIAWLYFFDPRRSQEFEAEPPEPNPEDFEDFEWYDEDMPF